MRLGSHHTLEAKAKMSISATGKRRSETIRKSWIKRKYKPVSEATRQRMRASHLGKKASPEAKAKMSRALMNRKHSPTCLHCAAISGERPTRRKWASAKDGELMRLYRINTGQLATLRTAQGNVCAICRRSEHEVGTLGVDYSHLTGRVRGLLCDRCNRGIGMLGDSCERLCAAAEYLARSLEMPPVSVEVVG